MGNCCACISSSNDEENAIVFPRVVDLSHLDEVISFIETRLKAIDKSEESTSNVDATTNSTVVDSSIEYGYILLHNVLKRAHKSASKVFSGETRKLLIDILKETAQIHWVVSGLGVVAYVLDQMDKISANKNECVQFLRYMCGLAKQIKQLDNHLDQEKLRDVVAFIVNGSFFCISRMQANNLSRFLDASMDAEELKGLQSQLAHTYPDLTLDAVIQILNRVPITLPPTQGQDPNAVGIDEARGKVIGLLDLEDESSVRGVVLYGVGGIGKTTLATAVFSSLHLSNYKHSRINIQQDCSESNLKQLQEQILKDLFAENIQLRDCDEGKERLYKLFRERTSQPLFLFIDNALRESDLRKLLPKDLSCLSKGSRILITTRKLNETDMIEEGGIKRYAYNVNYLSNAASKQLLCLKALGRADKVFEESLDIDGIVKLCGGVPLVLEIVGSMLRKLGNDVGACESTIEFLKDTVVRGEGDLSEKLVDAVYNTLENGVYRDAFLDIAAYFNKWSLQIVSCIVGEVALKALLDAALVRISEDEELIVHDIIEVRGRKLSEGDRISDYESIQRALQDPQRLEKLKGIWLPQRSWSPHGTDKFQLQTKHLELMKESLRVLYIGYGYELHGERNKTFLDQGSLPDGFVQLKSLRLLSFDHYDELKRLPESFGNLSALKMLNLQGSGINGLPNSFGLLNRLEELDMSQCRYLESLPQSFSHLTRLKKLNISDCSNLLRLPDGFSQLKSLTYLHFGDCYSLEMVSDDFGELSSVCAVNAQDCSKLDGNTMDKLLMMKSLQVLNIERSRMLIKRGREIKTRHPLMLLDEENAYYYFKSGHQPDIPTPFLENSVSSALFHKESRFLHNDEDLYFCEWSPDEGQEVAFVVSMCDMCSPSNKAALERVKVKITELASQGIDVVYMCMGQNMEGIRQILLNLPVGTRAWIGPDEKSNKVVGYCIYRLVSHRRYFYTEPGRLSRYHTVIAGASISVADNGEKNVVGYKLDTSDVEEFKDIAGGFRKFFFPLRQMEKFAHHYYVEE